MENINPERSIIESKESASKVANLTVYLMRHGESNKDKTNPNRGLTEKGREEVTINFNGILDQIIKDEIPDFDDFDNPEQRKKALQQAIQNVELHITDSGTDRTSEQAWQERQMLIDLGVNPDIITIPRSTYKWALEQGHIDAIPDNAGPGVKRRLDGVRGLSGEPDFRKKLDSREYQEKTGVNDTLIAWALTPDDEIPESVETRKKMEERLQLDLGKVKNIVAKRLNNHEKRVIYFANSHASIITLATASELNVPMEKLGEVDNAEGLRFDFHGPDTDYTTQPFGENLPAKIESLKKEQ